MVKNKWLKSGLVLLNFLMITALMFSSLRWMLTSTNIFYTKYQQLNHGQSMGMSIDDLVLASQKMIGYMEGYEKSIDLEVSVYGQRVSMFNDRERQHMVDVKNLYQGWKAFSKTVWVIYVGVILFLLFRYKVNGLYYIAGFYIKGALLFGGVLALMGIFILVDFNAFWTGFHLLFFTNDLWLLDPSTSRMINMMPLELFYGIVTLLIWRFVNLFAPLFVLALCIKGIEKRKKANG